MIRCHKTTFCRRGGSRGGLERVATGLCPVPFFFATSFIQVGDSTKYLYLTTRGMNILSPSCLRKFRNALFTPPHALRISKSLTPPPVRNFRLFFSDPLEILSNCLKFLTNGKHLGSHLPPELNPLASYAVGIPHWGTSPCLQNSSP